MVFFVQKNRIKKTKPYSVGIVLGLLALITLPLIVQSNDYILQIFTHALLLASLALAWNLLGVSGSISLGHAAFFGVGAYSSALLSLDQGLSPWLTIPIAGLFAAGLGMMMGLICLRLRGAYFALATLAFVEIPRVLTDNWDALTRGSLGLVGISGLPTLRLGDWHVDFGSSSAASYYLMFMYFLVLLSLVTFVFRSNFGLALQAIREEEVAAEAVGIQTDRFRLFFLLLSAFFTGISGACYAHLVRYIEPGLVYGLHFSAIPMIFAICGGRFTILGPALAAMVLYPADQFIFHPLLPAGHEFLYGAVLILTVLFVPNGFWGRQRSM
ncbi:MAG: branched-chain amino acid ABC transporter permease [Deltaproteobacteria bacterium]|jgi:branched-chain amino acid transport system permease protein|nr:branched-chain amino acid ABC transporter permease [Deltaproteobacteria bacterium]